MTAAHWYEEPAEQAVNPMAEAAKRRAEKMRQKQRDREVSARYALRNMGISEPLTAQDAEGEGVFQTVLLSDSQLSEATAVAQSAESTGDLTAMSILFWLQIDILYRSLCRERKQTGRQEVGEEQTLPAHC